MTEQKPHPPIVSRGRAPYPAIHAEMLDLLEQVRRGESSGEVWLVEHDPVYTAGRATPADDLREDIVPIERGGRITYHGPGQLVVYPIAPLPQKDVRDWLRRIEAFGVAVCAAFGLEATPSVDGTGVFVGRNKVASIGVAIRHWINFHGIAINVAMDLAAFHSIRPCGLDPDVMSDLRRESGADITMDHARAAVGACLPVLFDPVASDT